MPFMLVLLFLQSAPATTSAPRDPQNAEADKILEASIAARGGREAFAKLEYRYYEGEYTTSDGDKGTIRFLCDRHGRYRTDGRSDRFGAMGSGSDGTTAWTNSGGYAIETGERREYKRAECDFDIMLNYDRIFERRRHLGADKIDDRRCDLVRLTTRDGRSEDWFIDRETHLVVRITREWVLGHKRIEVVRDIKRYRDVDGVKVPDWLVESGGPMTMETKFERITHQPKLIGNEFALPAEVRELLKTEAASRPVTQPSSRPSR